MDREKFDKMMAESKAEAKAVETPEPVAPGMQFGFDVVEVRRVALQPGDVLMVTVKNDELSQESVDMLRKQLNIVFPENKVFVFAMGTSDDINLEVMAPAKSVANDCNTGYCSDCDCGKKASFEVKPSELNAEELQTLKELNEQEEKNNESDTQ